MDIFITPECARHYRSPYDALGLLPVIITDEDDRPVADQIADRYAHGGGYSPYGGDKWQLEFTRGSESFADLRYPGDSAMLPLAYWYVREELCLLFPYALVCIVQPDDSFVVTRMD